MLLPMTLHLCRNVVDVLLVALQERSMWHRQTLICRLNFESCRVC